MRKVVLKDGTILTDCTDSTTVNEIYAVGLTYEEAGKKRDLFTSENSKTIVVKNENDDIITSGTDLVLLSGATIIESDGKYICEIKTRLKTDVEKMQDEIAELQEVVIEG